MNAHSIELPPQETSPARARGFAAERLHRWGLEAVRDVVAVLVSELVTNGIRHARTGVRLSIIRTARGVRIDVDDGRPDRAPAGRRGAPTEEGGRGLLLVQTLSSRWGCERRGGTKRVWAELDT